MKTKGVIVLFTLLLFTSTTFAQSPTDYKLYLPIVVRTLPDASKMVLQLSDFPAGYALDPAKSGPADIPPEGEQFNVVEIYVNSFDGPDNQTDYENQIFVFATAQDAINYFNYRTQKLIDDTANNPFVIVTQFPVPAYGDRRNGFELISFGIKGQTIMFQSNQTVSRINGINLAPYISQGETIGYAGKSWSRVSAGVH